jgi:hypothetical protein
MTTAAQFRSAVAHPGSRDVLIAGVPWPVYKVAALLVGILVLGVVAVLTTIAASAVLSATAATTAVWWLGLTLRHYGH